jgi:hypothetical protein
MTTTDRLSREEIEEWRNSWRKQTTQYVIASMALAYLDTLPSGAMRDAEGWAGVYFRHYCDPNASPKTPEALVNFIRSVQADARSHAPGVAEGWVLVPKIPTDAMLHAAGEIHALEMWEAMIAAADQHPSRKP